MFVGCEAMKAVIIYFTMGGRTKKTAIAIGDVLSNYEVDYFPMELKGNFFEKIKELDLYQNNDFSLIEEELKTLDAKDYELIIIGMPTYGDQPANAFNEIVRRVPNLKDKKTAIYTTARFSGGKALKYMKEKVQETGAQIIKEANFRRVFWLGKRKSTKFGMELNEI